MVKYRLKRGCAILGVLFLAGCSPSRVTDVELGVEAISYPQPSYDAFQVKKRDLPKIQPDLVDAFYHQDEDLRLWIDTVKTEAGVYVQSIGDYDYVVLVAGEQPTTGYGMGFLGAYQDERTVYVVYSLIEPDESLTVSKTPSYPFMLLRFSNGDHRAFKSCLVEENEIDLFFNQN